MHFVLYAAIELSRDTCIVKGKGAFEHSTGLHPEQFSAVKILFTVHKVAERAREKH